jgi:hypothetical protein
MDIVGFTKLSSSISADELILLLNAIYTKIDRASERIGKVWKVETIGDCLIGTYVYVWVFMCVCVPTYIHAYMEKFGRSKL